MHVIGYAYNAAVHCVSCTLDYARNVPFSEFDFSEYSSEDFSDSPGIFNLTKGIELEVIRDSEGNPIHPIFDTDEAGDTPEHCDDCGEFIDTSWSGETVNYAIERITEYITDHFERRKLEMPGWRPCSNHADTLDIWAENLKWCGMEDSDETALRIYNRIRARERAND